MNTENFWTSQDGVVRSQDGANDDGRLRLTLEFPPRDDDERDFIAARLATLRFSERSTLARIGIDIIEDLAAPEMGADGQVLLQVEAFVIDPGAFQPTSRHIGELLRPGVPVGRLFHAPESARLTSSEVLDALADNKLKLPDSLSVDQRGHVWLTPHRATYTLPQDMSLFDLERLVRGHYSRTYLNSIQKKHVESGPVSIPARSGILSSCSMYLQEHYVVLTRGDGRFGLHTAAVLLDPVKTFGSDIMLEIYNPGDHIVVNPMVCVEIYRAPRANGNGDPVAKRLADRRQRLVAGLNEIYANFDADPDVTPCKVPPITSIEINGQTARIENESVTVALDGDLPAQLASRAAAGVCAYATIADALANMRPGDDALITDIHPNFIEHVEILSRVQNVTLRHLVFRKASRDHPFFLSDDGHSRLVNYERIGIHVHWLCPQTGDLYRYIYKKNHGFWIREEKAKKFVSSTIFAMYGSAVDIGAEDASAIDTLIAKLTAFFGPSIGFLTGGGGGVMETATEAARAKGCLTGACFLELEAQPPALGVDFFNTFQETSRHNRQKWFEIANFCIFNVGGLGTLEEIGIELCNLKLDMRPRTPYIFFGKTYWTPLRKQIEAMVSDGRAKNWILDYILFTDDANEVVNFYRKKLEVA